MAGTVRFLGGNGGLRHKTGLKGDNLGQFDQHVVSHILNTVCPITIDFSKRIYVSESFWHKSGLDFGIAIG